MSLERICLFNSSSIITFFFLNMFLFNLEKFLNTFSFCYPALALSCSYHHQSDPAQDLNCYLTAKPISCKEIAKAPLRCFKEAQNSSSDGYDTYF